MKTIVYLLLAAASIASAWAEGESDQQVAAVTVAAATSPAKSGSLVVESANLPPVEAGDTCVYQLENYGKTWIEREEVFRVTPVEYETLWYKDGVRVGTRRYLANGTRIKFPILRYPMAVGNVWPVQYEFVAQDQVRVAITLEGRVVDIHRGVVLGRELLLVAIEFAGEYEQRAVSAGGSAGGRVTQTTVYAPEIRCTVNSEYKVSYLGRKGMNEVFLTTLTGFKKSAVGQSSSD